MSSTAAPLPPAAASSRSLPPTPSATRDEIFLLLLAGVDDPGSFFFVLRGMPHLVKLVYQLATNEIWWKKCVRLPDAALDRRLFKVLLEKGWVFDHKKNVNDNDRFLFFTEIDPRSIDEQWNAVWATNAENDVDEDDDDEARRTPSAELTFPPPTDINVNMMPFRLTESFSKSGLPDYLEPYWPLVEKCVEREASKTQVMFHNRNSSEIGKICFLTVQESFVEPGKSQRRPGLHIDCPGYVKIKNEGAGGRGGGGGGGKGRSDGNHEKEGEKMKKKIENDLSALSLEAGADENASTAREEEEIAKSAKVEIVRRKGGGISRRYVSHRWGLGGCHVVPPLSHLENEDVKFQHRSFVFSGGIYLASNVDDSCRAWNCKIVSEEEEEEEAPEKLYSTTAAAETASGSPCEKKPRREAIGRLGNVEHLRKLLPDDLARTTKANRMYWLTDRTPHESLPLKEGTHRQFFRLVTSQVSLWYEEHSTPNPNGVKPNPKITKIVRGNKFDPEGVEIVDM